MIRTVLQILVPFLLPFLLYALWLWIVPQGNNENAPSTLGRMKKGRYWLISAGILCSLLGLILLGISSDGDPAREYIPPALIDGKIVPGSFSE